MTENIGWICPRCDRVNAPHVDWCDCGGEEDFEICMLDRPLADDEMQTLQAQEWLNQVREWQNYTYQPQPMTISSLMALISKSGPVAYRGLLVPDKERGYFGWIDHGDES
jgi:hypothetical protein